MSQMQVDPAFAVQEVTVKAVTACLYIVLIPRVVSLGIEVVPEQLISAACFAQHFVQLIVAEVCMDRRQLPNVQVLTS
jgi:hypothetical protein